jgi:lysozyme
MLLILLCSGCVPEEKAYDQQTLSTIKYFERFYPSTYNDIAGHKTIGYGHLLSKKDKTFYGRKLSEDEASELLDRSIANDASKILIYVKVSLTPSQRDALISLAYNIGVTGVKKSGIIEKINLKDWNGASDSFTKHGRAGNKIAPGLLKRRLCEMCLFAGRTLDPNRSDPPSVQWGIPNMKHADQAWHIVKKYQTTKRKTGKYCFLIEEIGYFSKMYASQFKWKPIYTLSKS